MRQYIILLMLNFAYGAIGQDQNTRILNSYYSFEKGSTEFLYGDNVVLRKKPNATSPAIDTLSIGTEIKIVEKTEETMPFNGLESFWYKVKYGTRVGYVLGGLIALDHRQIDDVKYFVSMAKRGESFFVRARVLNPDDTYFGHESSLNTNGFYLEVFDSRGVEGIGNMLVVQLFAEACGVDGGSIYLFNDGIKLTDAIQLSSVVDGGSFWFDESIIFPSDDNGYEGVVTYERHYGESLDYDMEQTREVVHTVVLRWENGAFSPNIDEIDFGNE